MAGGDATSIELEHLPRSLTDAVRARSVTLAPAPPPAGGVRDSVKEFERQKIVDALAKTNGNQTRAAELLGIPRRTLAYKMAKLGITS